MTLFIGFCCVSCCSNATPRPCLPPSVFGVVPVVAEPVSLLVMLRTHRSSSIGFRGPPFCTTFRCCAFLVCTIRDTATLRLFVGSMLALRENE